MKKLVIFFILLLSFSAFSQETNIDSVKWMSIEEAEKKFGEQQKPVLFYFYKTDCDSCRIQESTTFSNPEVSNYINILFYPVKINAETKDTITFLDGKSYINSGTNGKVHDLVFNLSGSADTFPAIVVFSKRAAGRAFKGYKDRDEIFRILVYYAEDIDLSTEFDNWYKYHKKGYPPGQKQIITRLNVKWMPLKEATDKNIEAPRKILLNLYNYNRISSSLMRMQTFNHPQIANYLNKKFYPVNIDVYTHDTLEIKGVKYINENKDYKYHQLPIAALGGNMMFPAFIFLDEKGTVIGKIQKYMTPEEFEAAMKYYGEDAYKKETFKAYKKKFTTTLNN